MRPLPVCTAALLVCFTAASTLHGADRHFETATVIGAEPYVSDRPGHRWKRTDARPPTTEYDYNVTLRIDCEIYVGRYKSPIDYLPGNLSANKSVQASADKHLLYVRVPGQDDVRMAIVDRRPAETCSPPH